MVSWSRDCHRECKARGGAADLAVLVPCRRIAAGSADGGRIGRQHVGRAASAGSGTDWPSRALSGTMTPRCSPRCSTCSRQAPAGPAATRGPAKIPAARGSKRSAPSTGPPRRAGRAPARRRRPPSPAGRDRWASAPTASTSAFRRSRKANCSAGTSSWMLSRAAVSMSVRMRSRSMSRSVRARRTARSRTKSLVTRRMPGSGMLQLRKEAHELGVLIVDLAIRGLGFAQRGVHDLRDDAALLIAEQRFQGIGRALKMTVKDAQTFRQIGGLEGARACAARARKSSPDKGAGRRQ